MRKPTDFTPRLKIALYIAIGVHIVLCLSLHYEFLNPLFYITTHAKGQGGAFFGIYQAGVNLFNGESIYANSSYNPPKEVVVPFYHFYRYLPFTSYVSGVVSRVIGPQAAYWTWIVINELLLATCIFLTLRLRKVYGTAAIVAAMFWLLYSPLYIELYMGQFCFTMTFFILLLLYPYLKEGKLSGLETAASSSLHGARETSSATALPGGTGTVAATVPCTAATSVAIPLAGGIRASRTGKIRDNLSPLCWILSLLLKSFTALYSLTLIRIGRKKLALAGISTVVITSVPYFMAHPNDLRKFIALNFNPLPSYSMGGSFGFASLLKDGVMRLLPSLNGSKLQLGALDISYGNIPILLVLGSIFLLTLLLTLGKREIDPLRNIALWTLTFFLVFRDIWEYHYVMLIPIFVGFYLRTRSKFILVMFVLLALPTPFALYDVPGNNNPQAFWSTPLSLFHHSVKAVPTLLLYLWIVKRELKDLPGIGTFFSPRRIRLTSDRP